MRVAANAVNAACVRKAVHLEMREAVAQCWRVACFGSGEVGDERSGFLTPTASHFDS